MSINHDFLIANADTDSISFCKKDFSPFNEKEIKFLLEEINNISPEFMIWENDGYFSCVIVLKAKNYILWDGKKLKTKGSSLRDQKTEKALREFVEEIIWAIIKETNNYTEIYNKYVLEILNIKDIKRWSSKKSVTEKVLSNDRTNESRIRDAISGTEYSEGDKVYLFFLTENKLELAENFKGEYDIPTMLEKLYKKAKVFDNVLPTKELFLNYSLKKNKELLQELINDKKF